MFSSDCCQMYLLFWQFTLKMNQQCIAYFILIVGIFTTGKCQFISIVWYVLILLTFSTLFFLPGQFSLSMLSLWNAKLVLKTSQSGVFQFILRANLCPSHVRFARRLAATWFYLMNIWNWICCGNIFKVNW